MKITAPFSAVLKKTTALACVGFLFSVAANHANAAILLYDGFDYTGSLAGQNGGIGWNGNAWATSATFPSTISLVSGLAFSDMAVSGGAVRFDLSNVSGGAPALIGRQVGTGIGTGSTLYSSYLFSISEDVGQSVLFGRVNTVSATNNTSNYYFGQGAKRNGSIQSFVGAGDSGISNSVDTENDLFDGTTFLAISRLSNVGGRDSITTQEGKLWILTAANYDAIKNSTITEALLDSNSTRFASRTTISTTDFTTTQFAQIFGNVTGDELTMQVDELKYFTSLSDLTVIPEPSTVALLLAGFAVAVIMIRRKKAQA